MNSISSNVFSNIKNNFQSNQFRRRIINSSIYKIFFEKIKALEIIFNYKRNNLVEENNFCIKSKAQELDNIPSPLSSAILNQNCAAIRSLIEQGTDPNETDKNGVAALHVAVFRGDYELIQFLIEKGADINIAASEEGVTCLHEVAARGSSDMVKFLISQGADVNKQTVNGYTALNLASVKGYLEIVNELILHGAEVNKSNKLKQTPLNLAARNGHKDITTTLLQNGADVNSSDEEGITSLGWASNGGHLSVVQSLIDHGADVNQAPKNGRSPLFAAACQGKEAVVALLMQHRADIRKSDNKGDSPFIVAARNGFLEIVKMLFVQETINQTNAQKQTALMYAANYGHLDVVDFLVRHGADINLNDEDNCTALYMATSSGQIAIAKYLTKHGADVNKPGILGCTPLLLSAANGHLDLVNNFIKHSANLEQSNFQGETPFMLAALYGNLEIVKVLIANGADVNKCDTTGCFPLVWVLANRPKNYEKIKRLIINKGSIPEAEHISLAKDILARKLIAHVAEIDGYSKTSPLTSIKLESFIPSFCWRKINKSLFSFSQEMPDLLSDVVAKMFVEATELADAEPDLIYQKWTSGNPVFINAGCAGHQVGIFLWKNYFLACDRSQAYVFKESYNAYTFDPELLKKEIIRDIQMTKKIQVNRSRFFFQEQLPVRLKMSKTDIEKKLDALPISKQIMGNCGWANSSGLLLPFLILHQYLQKTKNFISDTKAFDLMIKNQKTIFSQWESFQQSVSIQSYLNQIDSNSSLDSDLLEKAIFKCLPRQSVDVRIKKKWEEIKHVYLMQLPFISQLKNKLKYALIDLSRIIN